MVKAEILSISQGLKTTNGFGDLNQLPPDIITHNNNVDQEKTLEYLQRPAEKKTSLSLLSINTRLLLAGLNGDSNNRATLAEVPLTTWDTDHYQAIWFMGVYEPSMAAKQDSLRYLDRYQKDIPDITEEDIIASPFALISYNVNPQIARDWNEFDTSISWLREKGKKVFLDIVPNHVALDHPLIEEHPEYFIPVPEDVATRNLEQYYKYTNTKGETRWFARGKNTELDGYEDLWTDTLQLNHVHPKVREIIIENTLLLMEHVDGIRFDTADLLDPHKFIGIWGDILSLTNAQKDHLIRNDFWQELVEAVQKKAVEIGKEEFILIGEMQRENSGTRRSFDYVYELPLYRFLVTGALADAKYRLGELYGRATEEKGRPLVFIENHDVPRAVREFGEEKSLAAATIIATIPRAMWMVQLGQEEGRSIRHPMQVTTPRHEKPKEKIQRYYAQLHRLRSSRVFQEGNPRLQVDPNSSIIAQEAQIPDVGGAIICTNFSDQRVGRAIKLPENLEKRHVSVYNLHTGEFLDPKIIDTPNRNGNFYVELDPWQSQEIFYTLLPL